MGKVPWLYPVSWLFSAKPKLSCPAIVVLFSLLGPHLQNNYCRQNNLVTLIYFSFHSTLDHGSYGVISTQGSGNVDTMETLQYEPESCEAAMTVKTFQPIEIEDRFLNYCEPLKQKCSSVFSLGFSRFFLALKIPVMLATVPPFRSLQTRKSQWIRRTLLLRKSVLNLPSQLKTQICSMLRLG